jgi:hypothetical protein
MSLKDNARKPSKAAKRFWELSEGILRRVRAHLETQQRPQEEWQAVSLLQLPLPLQHRAEPGLQQQEISAGGAG